MMQRMMFTVGVSVLVCMVVLLQYRLWLKPGGVRDMLHLKQALMQQMAMNTTLKTQNDLLLFQIKRLKQDHDQLEERARNELGMIKSNERFYQVIPKRYGYMPVTLQDANFLISTSRDLFAGSREIAHLSGSRAFARDVE